MTELRYQGPSIASRPVNQFPGRSPISYAALAATWRFSVSRYGLGHWTGRAIIGPQHEQALHAVTKLTFQVGHKISAQIGMYIRRRQFRNAYDHSVVELTARLGR